MKKTIFLFLFSFVFIPFSLAQPLRQGEWRAYTAMNVVLDAALGADSTAVWVGTTGGAFRISLADPKTENILALRTSDGLTDSKVTAIGTDPDGNVYLGGEAGVIDVYSEVTKKMHSITDIHLSTLISKKSINQFYISGDDIYISANYGLSIFNRKSQTFVITVPRFGSLVAEDSAFATLEFNGKIFVVLSDAVAVADKNSVNLSAPSAWTTILAPAGTSLHSMALFEGRVFVGATDGLYEVGSSTLNYISVGADSINVAKLISSDSLYILNKRSGGRIISTHDLLNFTSHPIPPASSGSSARTLIVSNKHEMVIGYAADGVSIISADNILHANIFPAGPISNNIFSLSFSPSTGKLFIAHGTDGLSVFDAENSTWQLLGTVNNSPIPNANYKYVFYDSTRDALWASTLGSGLYKINFSGNTVNASQRIGNAGLQGTLDPNYFIAGQCILDNKANLICPTWAGNGEGLHISTNGDQFSSYQMNCPGDLYRPFGVTAQDQDGYYYLGTIFNGSPVPYGVVYRSLDGSVSGALSGSGSDAVLLNPNVNALIVDQDNALWCGTNAGVNIVTHSSKFQSKAVEFHARKIPFLDLQVVKTIAVDGVGNKWVGTDHGIFVVSPDGADSIARYTAENSPLIDNNVLSISIDTKNGEVYIATLKGISRTSSIFKEGNADYTKMFAYPNPVVQGDYDDRPNMPKVTFTGLVSGSTVKIYTISGRLIRTIDASQLGATVTWDGRDENGKLPPSGIYIVSATSALVKESGQTKFVLVRKNN